MLVNATEMLIKARDGHYGVPQFNINNLEWTKAVLTACEEMEYRASLEDRRVKAQKSAEDLRAQWNSVTSKLQRHTQRRLLRAFPTMKNDRTDEALRRLRAWMDEKKEN